MHGICFLVLGGGGGGGGGGLFVDKGVEIYSANKRTGNGLF